MQKKNSLKYTSARRGAHPGVVYPVLVLAGIIWLVLAMGCTGSPGVSGTVQNSSVSITDSQGNTFQLSGPATRIVCLNSDAAEMLVALGAGRSVVGVTETTLENTQLAPLLPNATSVGTWNAPSLERILGLQPDAIISYSGYRLKNADQFERAKIPVIYIDCNRLSTIREDADRLGTLTGHRAEAAKYSAFVDKWEAYVKEKTGSSALTSVYVEGYSDYMAQGSGSSIDDMFGLAGGSNLAAGQGKSYVKVTPEWVIKENPPVILKIAPDPLPEGKTLDTYQEQVADRAAFADLSAVQNKRVFALSGKVAVGPRAPAGLPVVAAMLHPEDFSGTDPLAALNEYAGTFVPGANSSQVVSPMP
jgi:iron complex transport system substrate-binding protein